MKILIDVESLSKDVWCADLSSAELNSLGAGGRAMGAVWVVLLIEPPVTRGNEMILESAQATVLNRGTTTRTVIVASTDVGLVSEGRIEPGRGDAAYLRELPAHLSSMGGDFLNAVRARWPGDLLATPAGRYVETPDNFWTVKIQPRDGSLRVTVRGEPERIGSGAELGLKRDRAGYSTFKIYKASQVPLAIALLGKASRR